MLNQKKTKLVEDVLSLFEKTSNFTLIKFDKTTHKSLETLRKDLKKSDAQLKIMKNTLFEKVVNKLSSKNKMFMDIRSKFFPLKKSTGLLSLKDDWSEGLKAFYNFIQKDKTLSFKFGLLDGQLYNNDEVERIAKLPGKNQLLANIIGSVKNPTSKLVYGMKFNINKFVYILNQKSKTI